MAPADIKTKQVINTLGQLHAGLAGKFLANHRECIRLKTAMMQVEAVMQMLQPGFSVATIAAKRRNKSNPWFKRGTLFRSAVDVLRRATGPMTTREIAGSLDSRQRRPGVPEAVCRPAGRNPRCVAEAGWRGRGRRGDAGKV